MELIKQKLCLNRLSTLQLKICC